MPKKHTLEKRLAVVLAGLRAEDHIREICKEHGVEVKSYYRWKNAFLEGGKQALGDEGGEPDGRARELETEIKRLKELAADLSIENHLLKKASDRWILHPRGLHQGTPEAKLDILRFVQACPWPVKRALEVLGLARSTFYDWHGRFQRDGFRGLVGLPRSPIIPENKLLDSERAQIIATAKSLPLEGYRKVASYVERDGVYVSATTVYRVLSKAGGCWQAGRPGAGLPAKSMSRSRLARMNSGQPTFTTSSWTALVSSTCSASWMHSHGT